LTVIDICQAFTSLPAEISQLTELEDLQLSHNPHLLSIPADLSTLRKLKSKAAVYLRD